MAILKWDASRDMMSVHDRVTRLFEYALKNLNIDIRTPSPWVPPCDICEFEESFELKAELPGLDMGDIIIEVVENTLTIVGVRNKRRESTSETYLRVERNYGRFTRKFMLPCGVDEEKVTALLKDGLLSVSVPKEKIKGGCTVEVEVK